MAWSYTAPLKDTGWSEEPWLQVCWRNTWTLSETGGAPAGYTRLALTVSTTEFWTWTSSGNAYAVYCTDTIACGGTTLTIKAERVINNATNYTATVDVPIGWEGKTVRLDIARRTVNVTLGITAAAPSPITAADGTFGAGMPITLTPVVSGVLHTLTVRCAGNTETLLSRSASTLVTRTPAVETYAPLLPDAGSCEAVITCETFYNGGSVGTSTATVTVSFAAGSLPPALQAGWAVAEPLNEGAAEGFTVYIQGYSMQIKPGPSEFIFPWIMWNKSHNLSRSCL